MIELIHLMLVAAAGASSFTPANIMNKYDFLKAEITTMDYTRQICPKNAVQNELSACTSCYKKDTCVMSMVGFESRPARLNPSSEMDPTSTTTVLLASFIGAPTFIVSYYSLYSHLIYSYLIKYISPLLESLSVTFHLNMPPLHHLVQQAGNFRSNGTTVFDPSFMASYVAPETRETFWNAVGNNVGRRSPKTKSVGLDPTPFVYSPFWYDHSVKKKNNPKVDPTKGDSEQEVNIMLVLKEIIEFDDKNNNGQYDSTYDGDIIQSIQTECLSWSLPKNKLSFNKTVAFSGETSSWQTASKSFVAADAPFDTCVDKTMPSSIPSGLLSFNIETSNLPAEPSKPTNVYDTTPTDPLLVTQNGLKVTIRVKDFPFKSINQTKIKSRLAFRFLIACDDFASEFQLYDLRRLINRKKPSHVDNGYFEWQPNARVKFPGSESMFGDLYKEQPLRPVRGSPADEGMYFCLMCKFYENVIIFFSLKKVIIYIFSFNRFTR
jgi:hypothetical protein